MSDTPPELSAQQLAFVQEYAKDRNGVRSALAAGLADTYSAANEQARTLLQNPAIKYWLRRVWNTQKRRLKTGVPELVREWATLGLSDLTDYVVTDDGRLSVAPGVPRSALRAVKKFKQTRTSRLTDGGDGLVEEVRTEIELHGKEGSLKALYDHLHGPLPGEDKGEVSVETVTRILAAAGARQLQPGGTGTAPAGDAVVPQPRTAEPGVPQ